MDITWVHWYYFFVGLIFGIILGIRMTKRRKE